jgi:two-component system, OmpR family, response regulator
MTQDGDVRSGRGEPRERAGRLRDHEAAILRAGDLELDLARWTVHQAGRSVELSPTEFRLLVYLMRNQGRVLTREQILLNVWGEGSSRQLQIVDTYVSYLRRKLDPPLIRTERGTGYILGSAACVTS